MQAIKVVGEIISNKENDIHLTSIVAEATIRYSFPQRWLWHSPFVLQLLQTKSGANLPKRVWQVEKGFRGFLQIGKK